jgi:uncharacterized protein
VTSDQRTYESAAFQHALSDRAVSVFRLHGVLSSVVLAAVPAGVTLSALLWRGEPLLALIGAVFWLVLFAWIEIGILPPLVARRSGYSLCEKHLAVVLFNGRLVRTQIMIPWVRVQNVSIARGPVERRFGVANVSVFSSGGGVQIPALDAEVAEVIRREISERAAAAQPVEGSPGTGPSTQIPGRVGAAQRAPSERLSSRALRYMRIKSAIRAVRSLLLLVFVGVGVWASCSFLMDPEDVQLVVDELHGLEAVSEVMARMGGVGVGLSVLSVSVLWLVWTVGVFPLLSVRFRRHELEDDAFYLQTGVMTQTRYVVPYARMQSVSTVQGVIQRWCGVASLQVATAAFGVRSVRLDIEVAYDLSERILASIDGGRHVG